MTSTNPQPTLVPDSKTPQANSWNLTSVAYCVNTAPASPAFPAGPLVSSPAAPLVSSPAAPLVSSPAVDIGDTQACRMAACHQKVTRRGCCQLIQQAHEMVGHYL